MTDKHIFESAEGLVLASLRGAVAQNPALRLHAPTKTVYIAHPSPSTNIALISGGGAGHEPAHAGYTGHGMLTSSVSGDIFASPSAKQILAAIEFAAFSGLEISNYGDQMEIVKGREVLIVINNYTGDRLNFGLAVEQARAKYPGLNIMSVLNADDVSLLPQTRGGEEEGSMVGPRGLGGNILVCKVLGAYTAFGARGVSTLPTSPRPTLDRTKLLGDALVAHLRSLGATLGHCHVPGREPHSALESIPTSQIELGLGLHNEPGVRRVSLTSPAWIASEMVRVVRGSGGGWSGADIYTDKREQYDANGTWLRPGDETVLFINNLGGMSTLEMGAIVEVVRKELVASHGIVPARIYSAPYMTSLNAPGFSISLVNVTRVEEIVNADSPTDPTDLLALIDAPTGATSWVGLRSWPMRGSGDVRSAEAEEVEADDTLRSIRTSFLPTACATSSCYSGVSQDHGGFTWADLGFSAEEVKRGVRGAYESVFAAEADMTRFDTVVGDGDCGETFVGGGKAILVALDVRTLDPQTMGPALFVSKVGEILEGSMGGTIGALFAIFFTAWSIALRRSPPSSPNTTYSPLNEALLALGKHTPARPGDRTVVDALAPLCESVLSFVSSSTATLTMADLEEAVEATKRGAESTRGMRARLGRASYVSKDGDGGGVPPDPGAWGVAAMAEGFVTGTRGVRKG
ncbi:DAK1/DegV-like protein [Gyrodon lividus]|nr:DAK1/DegV-like protein [Gyrodon lividus]